MKALRSLLFVVMAVLAALFLSCAEPVQPTLDVSPSALSLTSGTTVQLTVTRRFPGGATDDVTNKVTYSTSDKRFASVDANGLLTAGDDSGSVIVRAYDPASDATGVTTFTVEPAKIDSIALSPSPAIVLTHGTTRLFTATAHYTDGTTKDVTTQVGWVSSDEAVATIGNTAIDKGLVSAVSPGETDITATDAETQVQGRSVVFVTGDAPSLVALVVTPNPGVVALASTFQFAALGVYSDGTSHDVTRDVTWTSSRPDIATIDANGLVTAVLAGDTTLTATGPEPSTSVKGSAAVKVVP